MVEGETSKNNKDISAKHTKKKILGEKISLSKTGYNILKA